MLRRRLERGEGVDEFAVLAELAAEGATDYLALRTRLAPAVTLGEGTSIFSSWVTDRPGGFATGRDRADPRARAAAGRGDRGRARHGHGRHACSPPISVPTPPARVLGGDVERGRVEMIHAVIWYSDLAGFTRLTDQVSGAGMLQLFTGHAEILGLLNDYAEILVDAIEGRGGQVLKFMGDGILAIFRQPRRGATPARRRSTAWIDARRRAAPGSAGAASARRTPIWRCTRARCSTAISAAGPARLHGARAGGQRGRPHRRPVPPARPHAGHVRGLRRAVPAVAARQPAGALGRYALRGVARPQMLFGLEEQAGERPTAVE